MSTATPTEFPKRFYKAANVIELDNGWTVELDGRALKTPEKQALISPSEKLAVALAEEWQRQGERIHIASMHLTRLANVAIDRTPGNRDGMATELAKYCETDLLCHLASSPADLLERQEEAWSPIREWAAKSLGVSLSAVKGIMATAQPKSSLDAAHSHAHSLDDFRLTGLSYACGLYGSALLALAVEQKKLSGIDAFELTLIDETYQAERWGWDDEAVARIEGHRREAKSVQIWFNYLE